LQCSQNDKAAIRNAVVNRVIIIASLLGCFLLAECHLRAQVHPQNQAPNADQKTPPAASGPNNQPANNQPQPRVQTQTNSNPFPEDTSSVPVMPTGNSVDLPPGVGNAAADHMVLPDDDIDPVRSPEEAGAAAEEGEGGSSSSKAGMGNLLPDADDDTQPGRRGKRDSQVVPEHHETAAEDENVGSYYLDNKNWRAALSRYQSALVLDPDNPEVYWGLAESERHLGDFASARANYLKVTDYDPDSHHGKDARKALKDPEIANAKPSAQAKPGISQQQ
jgi:tetratricopeptide (TPR) repeat protein